MHRKCDLLLFTQHLVGFQGWDSPLDTEYGGMHGSHVKCTILREYVKSEDLPELVGATDPGDASHIQRYTRESKVKRMHGIVQGTLER